MVFDEFECLRKNSVAIVKPKRLVSRVYANVNSKKPRSYWDFKNFEINYSENSRYKIGKLLGAGHFGKVYQAVDQKTNKDVAIKVLNKLDHYRETVLKREILALKAVQGGPNIIQYLDLIRDPVTNMPSMVFELAKDIQIRETIQNFTLSQVKWYFFEILKALDFCHSIGIIHRDVKPGNIMLDLDNKVLKLVDWGLAEFYHPGKRYSPTGTTLPFKSPEQLVGNCRYDYSVDLWSLGVTLASAVFMSKPFFWEKKDKIFKEENKIIDNDIDQIICIVSVMGTQGLLNYIEDYNIDNERTDVLYDILPNFKRISWKHCVKKSFPRFATKKSLDLVDKLLRYDHASRLTAKEAMGHPFFADV